MRGPAGGIALIYAWAALAGCGGGEPLDYETAMNLLRDHSVEPLKTAISSSPRFDPEAPKIPGAYQKLMESHVLECSGNGSGLMCSAGAAGEALTPEGAAELSLVAGQWAPTTILSIQRSGRNRATAEVQMSFEPTPLYHEFEAVLSDIQTPAAAQAMSETRLPKQMHATFARYDDGWHLESLD